MNQKLTFGILCNELVFEHWEADCIEQLIRHPQIELKLIISNNNKSTTNAAFLKKIKTYPYRNFLYRFYKRFCLRTTSYQRVSLEERLKHIDNLKCKTERKGRYSEYFSEADIAVIKNYELDFMLRFGFNIIKGDILNSCKHGVWSFHHADNDYIRGGPIGFWEIYLKRNTTAAVLQKLNDQLDQGVILRKGYLKTIDHSYSENIDQLTEMASKWPLQVCIDLLNRQKIEKLHAFSGKAKLYKFPVNWQFAKFLFILFTNKIKFHINQLFTAESWHLALYEGKHDLLEKKQWNEPVYISKSDTDCYHADPFLWPDSNTPRILFEYYSYKEGIGAIAMNNIDGSHFQILDFKINTHLSYPFCFSVADEIYCIPEQAESNGISLYSINKSGSVSYLKDLVSNVAARDATLIFYKDVWWLFCTKAGNTENAALYIFYASELTDSFTPHANNPVKVDVQNSRPAGPMFIRDQILYRPAQNSAKHYGHKVHINKIVRLSPYDFEECIVNTLEPEQFGNYKGIHHIAVSDQYTVVDLKSYHFSWNNFKHQLKRKWNKIRS